MKFGLFTSAQANSGDLGPESGQGFRDYLDFNVAAERLGFVSSFSVEHHFTGWNQVSATLMVLTALAMRTTTLRLRTAAVRFALGHTRTHHDVAARPRGDLVALAQSRTARRTGRNARSGFRGPLRFRHRQRLPPQRV